MISRRFAAASAVLFLIGASATSLAQTTPATAPAKPAATAPAPTAPTVAAKSDVKTDKTTPVAKKVNINTATAAELDGLPQIGEKRSADIIKHRPYKETTELVSKKVLTQGVYDKIKDAVVVR